MHWKCFAEAAALCCCAGWSGQLVLVIQLIIKDGVQYLPTLFIVITT